MQTITSADGTLLALDQLGSGAPLVVVTGATVDRRVGAPVADALAEHFTVLSYDRRGRGDSGDALDSAGPTRARAALALRREVEDVAAVLDAAGGSAVVVGLSSGAALAVHAAAAGLPVRALVLWEVPWSTAPDAAASADAFVTEQARLLDAGDRDGALQHFYRRVGIPEEMIQGMRTSPFWQQALRLAPTLAYDSAALGDTTPPVDVLARVTVPALVLAGGAGPAWMRETAEAVAAALPDATYRCLDGQDHNVDGRALAGAVVGFTHRPAGR